MNPTIFICNIFEILDKEIQDFKEQRNLTEDDECEENVDLPSKLHFLVSVLLRCLETEGNRIEIDLLHELVE